MPSTEPAKPEPFSPAPNPGELPSRVPRRTPDAWALDKHGEPDPSAGPNEKGKRRLKMKAAFLLGGCKVHMGWVEGDEVTEQAFDIAMAEFAATPVGR